MRRFLSIPSLNVALFWKFFMRYLMLILLPAILAASFLYFYVVNYIEEEIEQSNQLIIKQFSNQSDNIFSSLQSEMINLLSTSNLYSLFDVLDEPRHHPQRMELIHSLMKKLRTFEDRGLIENAFLYFVHDDLVIDGHTYVDKTYFFNYRYPIDSEHIETVMDSLTYQKMMYFTDSYKLHQSELYQGIKKPIQINKSIVMSYPFNKIDPEVYLVVNLSQQKLDKSINIDEQWIAATAIIDKFGDVISETGTHSIDVQAAVEAIRSNGQEMNFENSKSKAFSLVPSQFDDSIYYVSVVDLNVLMAPARFIRMCSIIFLLFALILGGIVSYYLSRRSSQPILEIKSNLESYHRPAPLERDMRGDEYEMIKQMSKMLISENVQLSGLVDGMVPIAHEHFIKKILHGEFRDTLSISFYAQEIGFTYVEKEPRTVFCIEMHYFHHVLDGLSETSKSFIVEELKAKISKSIDANAWLCHIQSNLLACVIHHEEGADISQYAQRIAEELESFSSYFKAAIGVGKTVEPIEKLYVSYNQAMAVLRQQTFQPGVEICYEENISEERMSWDSFLSTDEVRRFVNLINSKQYDALLPIVNELLDEAIRYNISMYQVKNLCADILSTWIRAVESERNFDIRFFSELFDSLDRFITWEEIKAFFEETHQLLFPIEQEDEREKQFAQLIEYINEHYGEDLSIEKFAKQMNMSTGHFSRVFRDVVGEKYVEYVTKIRLHHAKKLLLETNERMDVIAERVGYLGRNSFIRVFRKYEGITPGKYRETYQDVSTT